MAKSARKTPQTETTPPSRIPNFSSIEEEAEFWDTHDLGEFEDELEEVTDIVFVRGGPTKALTVRLDEQSFAELQRHAAELGVKPARLARLWLFRQLWELEKKRRSGAS